ncbi:MAG: hypothetical protein IPP90_19495 [Gemmatimonadaceae bacterium]|nr:hypothetical protein [Gemmatimonadaceae bacterium]
MNRCRDSLRLLASLCTAYALVVSACSPRDTNSSAADSQAAHVRDVVAAGGTVDSIHPIAEQLQRFQVDVAEPPDSLRHASASIDGLVTRWARAVATRDTASLNRMTIDRAEFAWLYYPGSRLSKPPYEAPPQLLWGQILDNSDGGARQLFARFGGSPFQLILVKCPAPSDTTSTSLVYTDCSVRVRLTNGHVVEDRLFGSIIEHQGRFKFLGYANRL